MDGEVDVVERGELTEGLDDLFHPHELVGSRHDRDLPVREPPQTPRMLQIGDVPQRRRVANSRREQTPLGAPASAAIEGKVQPGVTPAGGAAVVPAGGPFWFLPFAPPPP